jgi:hypothetical protein
MKCALGSLSWNWFLAAYVALIAAQLFAPMVAHATQPPPLIDIPPVTTMENAGAMPFVVTKTKANSYSKVRVQTVDGTAKAGIDYKPIDVTLTLANNATSTRLPVTLIDNATFQGTRAFSLRLTVLRFGQVPASYTPITGTITDDEAAPAPPQPPLGLGGEAAIADNYDPTGGIIPVGGPAPVESNPMLGAFRMFCTGGQLRRDDPMVNPGQLGATHLHQFFGNDGTNAFSNYQSLRTTGGTTCGQSSTPFNRSAYWFPAMLDGVGNVLKPDYIKLYYERNSNKDPLCSQANTQALGQCVDLANGIRYVFGYNMKTGEGFGGNAVLFTCAADADGNPPASGATGRYLNLADLAAAGCPIGGQVVIAANSPNCWSGDLDSADHRSHMAYASGPYYAPQQWRACVGDGAAPGHPYMMPNMELLIYFTVDANLAKWHLSSDEMVPGARAGSTFHVDYWEGWSPTIKARWHAACINQALSCGGAAVDNQGAIAGGDMPWPNGFPKHQLVPLSTIP